MTSADTVGLKDYRQARRGFVPDRVQFPALAITGNNVAFQSDSGQSFMAVAERETRLVACLPQQAVPLIREIGGVGLRFKEANNTGYAV
jgi:hypothetical protein